jgi:hypothetical protein
MAASMEAASTGELRMATKRAAGRATVARWANAGRFTAAAFIAQAILAAGVGLGVEWRRQKLQ